MTDDPQAANDEPLFNIPAFVWRSRWHMLYGSPTDRIAAMYFWLGVCTSGKFDDPDYEDRCLLVDVSIQLVKDNE